LFFRCSHLSGHGRDLSARAGIKVFWFFFSKKNLLAYFETPLLTARFFKATLVVLAFFWLTQNIRPIPAGNQAIVSRFGAVVRVQQGGVLVAWPPPLEHVVVLPVGERQLLQNDGPGLQENISVLTADGNVAVLTGSIGWRAGGAPASAVAPVLRAAFDEAAVFAGARHALADLLPPHEAARHDIALALTDSLAGLDEAGAGLDVQITRADVVTALPAAANATLEAQAQQAEAALAAARMEAAGRLQRSDRDRARIFADAHAAAAERIAFARSSTATLTALGARMSQATRPALLSDLYRARIAGILHQAGGVTTVDPKSVSKVIIPDAP
jgi:regulator of protease activity HflC (stomatin/prohibitin superfamily)